MSQTNQALVRIATHQSLINVPGLPIPYVLQAEPYQPSDMSSVQCPFFVNELALNGGVASLPISSGMQYVQTLIDMMLAVQRREAGIDLKYSVQNTLMWRDAVLAQFAAHVKLSYPAIPLNQSTFSTPIQCTTIVPHGLTNADQVAIAGVTGNTNANGSWNINVVDAMNFTLTGSVGNGTGGVSGTERKLQPVDLAFVTDVMITGWELVDYTYGSTEFLAIRFPLRLSEMYPTPISG